MSERDPHGEVRTEAVDDRILVITVDRVEKKNAFTPKLMFELREALTRLDESDDLWVGVIRTWPLSTCATHRVTPLRESRSQ